MSTNKYPLSYRGFLTILFFIALVMFIFAEPIAEAFASLLFQILYKICKILGGF